MSTGSIGRGRPGAGPVNGAHATATRRRTAIAVAVVWLSALATLVAVAAGPAEPAGALTPNVLNTGTPQPPQTLISAYGFIIKRDGGFSIKLPNNRTLWIFADTARFNGSGGLVDISLFGSYGFTEDLVNRSLLYEGIDSKGRIIPLIPGGAETCTDPVDKPFAWPINATPVPSGNPNQVKVILYYTALCGHPGGGIATAKHVGAASLVYDATTPNAPLQATVLNQNLFPLQPKYGQATTFNPADGKLYTYGCVGQPCTVARVDPAQAGDPAAYRYFDGSNWVVDPAAAAPVGMGGSLSQTPSVTWVQGLGRFVSFNAEGNADTKVRIATAPEGPWSLPVTVPVAECGTFLCITTAIQGESSDSDKLRLSYSPMPEHVVKTIDIPVLVDPFGSIDGVTSTPSSLTVRGWTIDPDTSNGVVVGVFLDGAGQGFFNANASRPDVGAAFPGYGNDHGFEVTIPATVGPHTVCVSALNQVMGTKTPSLGCQPINVYAAPGAPQNPAASAGDTQALVSWSPPLDLGGAPLNTITYKVTANPPAPGQPFAVPAGQTSLVVNNLTNGTPYTFSIQAFNPSAGGPLATTGPVTPQTIAGARFHPMAPTRFLDSRDGTGWSGKLFAGFPRSVQITGVNGVPANATAVVMNVAVTGSTANSFLTAFPAGTPAPTAANLNFAAGETVSNLTTVKVGLGGKVSFLTALGNTDVVGDVVGWYDDGTIAGELFNPKSPDRFLDSRNGTGWSGKVVAGVPRSLQITGVGGIPANASAVVMNVTVTESSANSYLTVFPNGQGAPLAANLNFAAGQTIGNLTTVKIGAQGKVNFATGVGATHIVADVVGWYEPTNGGRFHSLIQPTRILDDRNGTGGFNTPLNFAAPRDITVAGANGVHPDATALIANNAITGSTMPSYLTVWPTGQPMPLASNLNFAAGETRPNLAITKLGAGGKVSIFTQQGQVSVIMDAAGFFKPT